MGTSSETKRTWGRRQRGFTKERNEKKTRNTPRSLGTWLCFGRNYSRGRNKIRLEESSEGLIRVSLLAVSSLPSFQRCMHGVRGPWRHCPWQGHTGQAVLPVADEPGNELAAHPPAYIVKIRCAVNLGRAAATRDAGAGIVWSGCWSTAPHEFQASDEKQQRWHTAHARLPRRS